MVEFLIRDLLHGTEEANAGIIDQGIDPAVLVQGGGDGGADRIRVRHVEPLRVDPVRVAFDESRSIAVGVTHRRNDRMATLGELPRRGCAKPLRSRR